MHDVCKNHDSRHHSTVFAFISVAGSEWCGEILLFAVQDIWNYDWQYDCFHAKKEDKEGQYVAEGICSALLEYYGAAGFFRKYSFSL